MQMKETATPSGPATITAIVVFVALVGSVAYQGNVYKERTAAETEARLAAAAKAAQSIAAPVAATQPTDSMPEPIARFVAFAREAPAEGAAPGQGYTAEGLRQLAGALDEIVDDPALARRVDDIEAAARTLHDDPRAGEHGDVARKAFISATDVMSRIQESRYPRAAALRLDIEEAHRAAEALDGKQPLGAQADELRDFFREASESVEGFAKRS